MLPDFANVVYLSMDAYAMYFLTDKNELFINIKNTEMSDSIKIDTSDMPDIVNLEHRDNKTFITTKLKTVMMLSFENDTLCISKAGLKPKEKLNEYALRNLSPEKRKQIHELVTSYL